MGLPMSHLLVAICVCAALGWEEGSDPDLSPAELEQNHYLAQLFGLYGENGTLSAGGLARLLHSLGLGGVQGLHLRHYGPPAGHTATPAGDNSTHRYKPLPRPPPPPIPHPGSFQHVDPSPVSTSSGS